MNLIGKTYTLSDPVPNRGDAAIVEYITNSGEFTTANNTVMIVDIPGRRAVTLDPGLPSTKGGNMEEGGGIPNPTYSFVNSGTIRLISKNTAGIEVQPDTHPGTMQVTGINQGTIQGENERQVALLFTDEDSKAGNKHTLKNGATGLINMTGDNSAGFATSNFVGSPRGNTNNQKSWQMTAINEGTINLSGNESHGMVVTKITNLPGKIDSSSGNFVPTAPKYELAGNSKFENDGVINVKGNNSGGMTILDKVPKGATNNKEINITGDNSFGLYSQDVFNSNLTKVVANETPIVNSASGTITIKGNATGSMGIRVGNDRGNPTGLKNEGTITIESSIGNNIGIYSGTSVINNDGTIEVKGNKNIGMMLKETKSDTNSPSENKKKITVDGTNGFGVMLIDNDNSAKFNNDANAEITATGVNSVGLYTKNSIATNKNGATISSAQHHAVVQNGGTFTNEGDVTTKAGGKVALYSENGSFESTKDGVISSENGGIAIFAKDSSGAVKGRVNVGDTVGNNTGIGVYLDASSTKTITFSDDAMLNLGKGTVGLYSEDASKFGSGFAINALKTSIGDGAALAYFGSTGTGNITSGTLSNLTVLKMGDKSTLIYGDTGSEINVDDSVDITKYSNVSATAQFLVSNQGIATVNSGKTITSNLKTTISGLNGATVTNEGTLALTGKDGAVGIYSNASTVKNKKIITTANEGSVAIYGKTGSTLTNEGTGEITTSRKSSVGIFADSSTATNEIGGKITTSGTESAGIYGTNNSTVKNAGVITTEETESAGIYANESNATNESTGTITSKKGSSAGIYAVSTNAKDTKNTGTIEVGLAGSSETNGVGIYAEGHQNVENTGNINIHIKNSIGIYGKGTDTVIENKNKINSDASASDAIGIMADKVKKVTNSSGAKIELQGKNSVGIYGKESTIENIGEVLLTSTDNDSKSVGILADKGTAVNKGKIKVDGGKSAGMLGLNGADVKNDANGKITMTGDESAGMYAENAAPSNAGTIEIKSSKSAGMFVKVSDSVSRNIENTGTIKLEGTGKTESVGMYAEVESGATGTTTLDNKNQITVDQEKSVGMYVKNATGDRSKGKAINNASTGKIDLNAKSTVGIYTDNAEGVNNNEINVTKENSAGMYGSNDSNITNEKTINVSHENSAGMYASDSNATNTADGTITLTGSTGANSGSAGMYGKLTSAATTADYTILNQGQIQLTSVTKNVGIYGQTDKSVSKTLILQNDNKIIIGAGSPESVGIFAVNEDAKNRTHNSVDKLKVINNNEITANSKKSIGISAIKSTVDNSGTITMNKEESAGIYGKWSSEVTNNNEIKIKENKSAGIYLEDSNATNVGTITIDKGASAGIYGNFTKDAEKDNTIVNNGTITLTATAGEKKSAGIYGKLESNAAKKLTISNNKKIDVNMEESVGIYAFNATGDRANLTAENNASDGEINVNSKNSVGMLANNSVTNNKNKIKVNNEKASGMYGENGSLVTNTGTGEIEITAAGEKGMGIYATGENTTTGKVTEGVNDGTINIKDKEGIGMLATAKGKVTNNKEINGSRLVEGIIGMYGSDDGTKVENASAGKIELAGKKSTGMFAKDDAVAENSGNIKLTSDSKNSVGMFGSSSGAGKKLI